MDGEATPLRSPTIMSSPFSLKTARRAVGWSGSARRAEPSFEGHGIPEPVAALLTQALALAALVAGIFKFDGCFSLQAKGDGPVVLLVADLTSDGALRGFAQFDAEALGPGRQLA